MFFTGLIYYCQTFCPTAEVSMIPMFFVTDRSVDIHALLRLLWNKNLAQKWLGRQRNCRCSHPRASVPTEDDNRKPTAEPSGHPFATNPSPKPSAPNDPTCQTMDRTTRRGKRGLGVTEERGPRVDQSFITSPLGRKTIRP